MKRERLKGGETGKKGMKEVRKGEENKERSKDRREKGA